MKKAIMVLAVLTALILTAGLTSACNGDGARGVRMNELNTASEVYGFSAASAGTLISAMNGGNAAQAAAVRGLKAEYTVDDEATVDTLNHYMSLVESLLGDGAFGMVTVASDREEYAVKEIVTCRDLLGDTLEYVLYYNETDVKEKSDEEGYERSGRIEGVMVIDGADYAIVGERKAEEENDESESEYKFTVALSETKFMVVKQETETEEGETENKFIYSVYENGELIERSSVKYESEDDETELKMSVYKDGIEQSFSFEEENGEITVKVGGGEGAGKYRVSIAVDEEGNAYYVYQTKSGKIDKERF